MANDAPDQRQALGISDGFPGEIQEVSEVADHLYVDGERPMFYALECALQRALDEGLSPWQRPSPSGAATDPNTTPRLAR